MSAVIYPQLSGVNWPSYLLQVWLTLHQAGVPPQNLRFLPEVGHFAVPEVTEEGAEEDFEKRSEQVELRHPRGPQYDPQTGRITVYQIDPQQVRPRLKVNVRADRRLQYGVDAQGEEFVLQDRQVGRLAHFLAPLLAGLPSDAASTTPSSEEGGEAGADLEDDPILGRQGRAEKPLSRLTRQLCARYPELMATVPYAVRSVLSRWADVMERALRATDETARTRFVEQAAELVSQAEDREALAYWFDIQADKLPSPSGESPDSVVFMAARARLRAWSRTLGADSVEARQAEGAALLAALTPPEIATQQAFFQELAGRLAQETPRERYRIARELVEILTTEAFTSVAVLDYLWGMAWVHGRTEDFCLPVGTPPAQGLFLSLTGGLSHRVLLLNMAQQWARESAFLGVSSFENDKADSDKPQGSRLSSRLNSNRSDSRLNNDKFGNDKIESETANAFNAGAEFGFENEADRELFTAGEQAELWALATWRRESPDPLMLLQTAAQRLIDPGIRIERDGYADSGGGFGTLFAQLGATAALGGMVQVHYPGILVYVPMGEDADAQAVRAKRKLRLLLHLFLPVCLRAEIVWREAVARLGQGAYLKHPFQTGARLGQDAPADLRQNTPAE